MTDKKFTDEEIIKALECCTKAVSGVRKCEKCPLYTKFQCLYAIKVYALDLINRQKAEIERLKECPKCVYEYDGEITEYCIQGPCSNFKTVEQIKSEAYKEFAEKLKRHVDVGHLISPSEEICFFTAGVIKIVDRVLEEMVGEEE